MFLIIHIYTTQYLDHPKQIGVGMSHKNNLYHNFYDRVVSITISYLSDKQAKFSQIFSFQDYIKFELI